MRVRWATVEDEKEGAEKPERGGKCSVRYKEKDRVSLTASELRFPQKNVRERWEAWLFLDLLKILLETVEFQMLHSCYVAWGEARPGGRITSATEIW